MRLILGLVITLAVMATGCAKQSTTATPSPNTAALDKKVATLEKGAGNATIGSASVETSKLGVPVYPGAKPVAGGGLSATTSEGSAQIVALTTGDAFSTVYAWYKSHLPAGSEKSHSTNAESSVADFEVDKGGGKDVASVELSSDGGKTQIVIAHGTKP
jgi:hypothetical protein